MTETTLQTAIWTPGWYELDQSLMLGERQKFWFYHHTPGIENAAPMIEASNPNADFDLVFYNQLDSSKNCMVRYAKIVEMFHPELGPLKQIDTDGLDYLFVPLEGKEIVVNAEEEPGTTYDAELNVTDWSVYVKLADVSDPLVDLA